MLDARVLKQMDEKLQRICNIQQPFANKVVVIGGDKMQLPPPAGQNHSIYSSQYMQMFHHFLLSKQMRQIDDPVFAEWLRQVVLILFLAFIS
jgi:hypothetical protein